MTITDEPVKCTPDGRWRARAACRGGDPERFFPSAAAGPEYEAQVAVALAVCAGCQVRPECLTWALDALPYGVAGAMTEQQRRDERARRQGRARRCRVPERPAGGTAGEVAAAGRAAIRAGTTPRAVAREFGVSERTAARWAAQVRAARPTSTSTNAHRRVDEGLAMAGTRSAEGHEDR